MKRKLSLLITVIMILSVVTMGLFSITANADDSITEYTITYHLDGGTNALKNPDVYTSEDVITLKDATKVGYTFSGWYLDEAKTQKITNISNRTGNIDLYAKFVPCSYAATFIGNGADKLGSVKITLISEETSESKKVYVEGGESFNPYDYWSPSAPGYVFLGWLYNGVVIDESIEINESSGVQIKAKWKKMTTVAPVLCYSYNLSAEYQSSVSFYTSNDACYITWSAYSEAYYSPHGTEWESSWAIIANGSYIDRSYINPGYRYGSAYVEPGTLVTAYCRMDTGLTSVELEGWLNISCSSKRYNDGEFIVSKNNQILQQEFDAPINTPSLSKKGYNFAGWYDENGNKMTETWQYTENQTFTAKWDPISYAITYNLNGGINNASNPSTYTIEDSATLQNPSKAGYTFKGWYSDSDFKTKVTTISKQTGNITLYAKWEVNSYNLTIDANNGSFAPEVTFISDKKVIKECYLYEQDTLTAYRPANKDGYIFAGWYKDANFTELFVFNGTITKDITLYAKWIECSSNTINIESADNLEIDILGKTEQLYAFVPLVDGTIVVTSSSDGLDLYGILYDATKNKLIAADDISDYDLDFSYTYNVKAGQLYYIVVKGNTVSTKGKATINVEWTGICTITGTTYPNRQITVVYGTNYTLPEKTVRAGYVFLGWVDENGKIITDGVWKFTTDKTLTAKWINETLYTDILPLIEDIAVLKEKCLTLESKFAYINSLISEHSSKCDNSTCPVEEYISDYNEAYARYDYFKYQINTLEAMVYELGDDGEIDIQKTNTLKADIEEFNYRYIGGDVIDADLAAVLSYVERLDSRCTTSVTISDGDTSIGSWEFDGYSSLVSVTIPNSVTSIGYAAFEDCVSLNSITFEGTVQQWKAITKGGGWDSGTGEYTVYCTDGEISKAGAITCYEHAWGDWYEGTAPTCTEDGLEKRECTICQHYETNVLEKLGHYEIHHEAKEPTDTEVGWHEYVSCSRCDYTTYEEIPSLRDEILPGDVNNDGIVTNADVLAIYRYIYNAKLYPLDVTVADVNRDGAVTNADVLAVYRYIYNPTLYPLG